MYTFLAVIMLMSVSKKNKILNYWSIDPMIITPMFGQLFSRDKFMLLLEFIHFKKSNLLVNDRLHKIRSAIDNLQEKFKSLIVPWKGHLVFE